MANVAAADVTVTEDDVLLDVFVDAAGGGGLASINSCTFRIHVDAIDALAAI